MFKHLLTILTILSYLFGQSQTTELNFSHQSGKYLTSFKLEITGDFDKLLYTKDGSNPRKGKIFKQPYKIEKTTVLRFTPIKNGRRLDTIITKTFFIDSTKFALTSICIDEEDLWNDTTGIYVKGYKAFFSDSTGHWENCNYQKKWEREINVEFFDTNNVEAFNQIAGITLFGETTRHYSDKSLRIVARSSYGKNRFSYPIFPEKDIPEYKHLVFRTSGNDYRGTRFKDALSSRLIMKTGLDYQAYRPVKLFINGKLWGIYNLREKVNEHFLNQNHGLHKDSVAIVMGKWVREEGSSKDYRKMYHWFNKLDTMDDKAYEKASKFLDIRNYINFRVSQIYLNNSDHRGNIRYWNEPNKSPKFRMIFYDTDHGFGYAQRNFIKDCISPEETHWYNPKWSTLYLRKLMQHKHFQIDFANQAAHLVNTIFHEDTILNKIDEFYLNYKDELPFNKKEVANHLAKAVMKKDQWEENVQKLRDFATERDDFFLKHINSTITKKGIYWLEIESENGYAIINRNIPLKLPFKGRYFKGVPLEVKITGDSTFAFNGFENNTNSIIITGSADTVRLAPIFSKIDTPTISKKVRTKSKKTISKAKPNTFYRNIIFNVVFYGLMIFFLFWGINKK